MALAQHSIKLFDVEIRPNSGSSSGHGCQDSIEKHLAGQFEVLGLAMEEIHFSPVFQAPICLPHCRCQACCRELICLPGEKQSFGAVTDVLVSCVTKYLPRSNLREEGLVLAPGLKVHQSYPGREWFSNIIVKQLPHV